MRSDELHRVFVPQIAYGFRIRMVLMIVGAGEDIDVEFFGRSRIGNLRLRKFISGIRVAQLSVRYISTQASVPSGDLKINPFWPNHQMPIESVGHGKCADILHQGHATSSRSAAPARPDGPGWPAASGSG